MSPFVEIGKTTSYSSSSENLTNFKESVSAIKSVPRLKTSYFKSGLAKHGAAGRSTHHEHDERQIFNFFLFKYFR